MSRLNLTRGLALAVAAAAASLLLAAPGAIAAPPANDDFVDREVLSGSLPVGVSRSNVGATKEGDEPIHGVLGSKGHSVWFEWEATFTGWVTVGACDGDFETVLDIYAGSTLNSLTRVTSGNPSEGPHCPYGQREHTFEATNGMSYMIAVDGSSFYLPPASPPSGEGSFALQIEVRPPPSNDDFQDAATLEGKVSEEPGGRRSYFASTFGFNWDATKESGEPDHDGDPGGASVWYSWTAPESGIARIGTCCSEHQIGVYTGGSVDALTQHEPTTDPPLGRSFSVNAGTTYRIAVDGKFDAGAAAAEMGSFTISASMQLPSRTQAQSAVSSSSDLGSAPPPGDTSPPDTFIHRKVLKSQPPTIVISFSSSEPGSTFRCRHNKGAFIPCRVPISNKGRRPGRHRFEVAAVDTAGNVDPSPAVTRFFVRQPKRPSKKPS